MMEISRRVFHLRRQLVAGRLTPPRYWRLLRLILLEHNINPDWSKP